MEDLEDGEEDVDFRFMSLLYHYLVFKPKRGLKENIMDENDELKQKEEVNNNIECQNIEEANEETKQDEIKIEECNNNCPNKEPFRLIGKPACARPITMGNHWRHIVQTYYSIPTRLILYSCL